MIFFVKRRRMQRVYRVPDQTHLDDLPGCRYDCKMYASTLATAHEAGLFPMWLL
jgi:hypothetical protein